MSSDKSSWSQRSCWSIRESKCSKKSSWLRDVFDQSGSQWAVIRAPDHNLVVGRSGSQCALIKASDPKMVFTLSGSQFSSHKSTRSQQVCRWIWSLMCSHKSSWSREGFDKSRSQWDLIRAPDHNVVVCRSGNQCALTRASDQSGSQWGLMRAHDHNLVVGRLWSQWALIRASNRKRFLIDWRSIRESTSSDKSSWSREVLIDWRLNELPIAKPVLLYEGLNELWYQLANIRRLLLDWVINKLW